MQPVKIEDLKSVVALSDLPDKHLQWILNHSEYREYADGDIITKYGDPAEVMWITLAGKVTFYMYINGRQVYYFTFENNNITGGIGGIMPYSRMKTIPGYSYAVGAVKLLCIHKKYFSDLEQLNPDFNQRLIGYMTDRAKAFATTQLQYEKVNALGSLAAGIAHEFNNPAAAISEIADELSNRINKNYELTIKLLGCNLTPQHLQNIFLLMGKKETEPVQNLKRTLLQRIDNEDEMEEWLEENGFVGRAMAETFSECGFSIQELENIRTDLGSESFDKVIQWLENLISSQKIVKDLAEASRRISNLVASIKSHVHMDMTNELQPTNIHKDIENTLTLLGFKLREKNIEVKKKFCQNMPDVAAYVGELNQVWTNLIDNAIYALEKNGSLIIETSCDDKIIKVSIIDNGSGIPKEIMSRIFDPLFTTKKIGEGTGIGLDIVNRVVKRHNGDINVTSEPGRTEFLIRIPIEQHSASN
ncbi:ATP-binding protein [Chitinophagaceae bacterium LB-8]|uniref:histidine kinase n=1 Tax=Paraflavisolibacter caeni TaxID=2982496 RepID=A0A9X2Y074_9BACT|nr:ATP-binding protein [Paraflavisolibacter caeni]MCU7552701.1 ATP-binding protein [Paraflavisolibacter caeni]